MSGAGSQPSGADAIMAAIGQAQGAMAPVPTSAPQMSGSDSIMAAINQAQAPVGGSAPPPPQDPMQPMPHEQPNWRQQLMGGPVGQFMAGAMQPIYGLDQLAYKGLGSATSLGGNFPNPVSNFLDQQANSVGDQAQQSKQSNALARTLTGGNPKNVPEILGQMASPANFMAGGVGGAAGMGRALLQGVAMGITAPAENGDDYWKQKAEQAGIGAVTGGIMHGAGKTLSAIADPGSTYGKDVATLLKANVPLTVGQILGGSAHRLEDAATSIPFVGDMVKARQRDAFLGLNTAAINRSLTPIGDKLPEGLTGHAAIDYAQSSLGNAYDELLPQLSATKDLQLTTDLDGIVNGATQTYGLVGPAKDKLESIVKNQVINKSNQGVYDGATLKDIQSNLSYQARTHSKSLNPDDKNLADALIDTKTAVNDLIARHNPNEAPQLAAINEGWANFARPQNAAERATKDGVFTPSQLGMAVRSGGTRSQNSTGNALMQDLSSAGQNVLPSTVPDSGTPLRHAVEAGAALAGAGLGGEHLIPGAASTALGAAGLGGLLAVGGSKTAQSVMRAALTKRPYSDATAKALGQVLMNAPSIVGRASIPILAPYASNSAPK